MKLGIKLFVAELLVALFTLPSTKRGTLACGTASSKGGAGPSKGNEII